ncbi:glutamate--cysteine ligase GCS2 [Thermovibrio ammonificans HB-1]|uniref:Putative glutamate--cysteine ligase 2 n=1 Tax=Thermovibrio ammonificans (strain DSM 15698 / JCM 12110 / HB-1) TaxID=648996 RepID=E8T634_THEA1|nr:YbdK family carboxylate-amine ligase [Thermovibrio ammonificans]ADU96618.1 glutamate--cysteine ligase GCS2 [Thermovibrio ammonificans HB-1]
MRFNPSRPLTVGIELEVQLLDPETFALKGIAGELFSRYTSPRLQREFLDSMAEFVTGVHSSPDEAVSELTKEVLAVAHLGKELGFVVAASGTHPFARPEEVNVTPSERYLKLLEEFQEVLRNFLIYGLHVHVGFPDEQTALNAYNAFVKFSPLFLALSASSPFFRGRNTGIYSYRSKLFEQLPRAGVPQQFDSYGEFVELFSVLKESKTVDSLKDIWWDVRPRPDLGTVELRVCDSVSDFSRIRGIVSLAVMVASLFMEEGVEREFHQVHLQNRWNAARHGLTGRFISKDGVTTVGRELLRLVTLYGKRFNSLREGAKVLVDLVSRPTGAELQLRSFNGRDFGPVFNYTVVEV